MTKLKSPHQPKPGSGQIAQPPYHPRPKPYRPTPHLRAAEIDALPVTVGMGKPGGGDDRR
jgi:hypothetical protein